MWASYSKETKADEVMAMMRELDAGSCFRTVMMHLHETGAKDESVPESRVCDAECSDGRVWMLFGR